MGREKVGLNLGFCLLIMMDTEEGEEVIEVIMGGTIRSDGTIWSQYRPGEGASLYFGLDLSERYHSNHFDIIQIFVG